MKSIFLGVMMLGVVYSLTAYASSFGGGKGYESGLFFGADLNRDERLSKDEAEGVHNLAEEDIFKRYDEDNSGFITRLEFKEYMQQKPWLEKFVHPKDK